ncbi:hypothetical protein EIK76_00450 [Rheinheimera mesophila]|uniref:Uncharacterized protein n=1 Tax=Rheinheimera mesophila TaxID=1547515 RepID=A0A3P3QMZ9_9GAMM|nr:hypothetical protein [Rheinheimera mesophila]KKL00243.1 hypothetical protein SD53_15685 [Rheinheimera mesophila]RRJ22591.1 hypothetical protein EIK76_00450 [Rheinheimera mesophila]
MVQKDCLLFVHDSGFDAADIWKKRKFVLNLSSFSDLMNVTHVILSASSFQGAFEVKFFEIEPKTDDLKVLVHFSKYYKHKVSGGVVKDLVINPQISNGISGACTFNQNYDPNVFDVVDFPELSPTTDLKSMQENIKKLYGQDVEVTITLKS